MSSLQVDQISAKGGSGTITIPTGNKLVGTDVGSIVASKGIVQLQYVSGYPTAHLSTVTTAEATTPLMGAITPKFANSVVKLEFFSTMCQGSASILVTILYRRINGGTWTNLTPATAANSRYTYGWNYNSSGWNTHRNVYYDTPNTTGLVEYVVNYRLWTGATIAYLVHQYMEYGYILTELKQ